MFSAAAGAAITPLADWPELRSLHSGETATIVGYPVPFPGQTHASRFLMAAEPPCCPGCAPTAPGATVEVEALAPVALCAGAVRLTGVFQLGMVKTGSSQLGMLQLGETTRLTGARLATPVGWAAVTRRRALTAGPLMCLPAITADGSDDAARAVIRATQAIDLHSHAGGIASVARMRSGRAFAPVAPPMRQGGMAVACLAVVSDGPTHRVMADGRIHPYRDPAPGELWDYGQFAFGRLHQMVTDQGLAVVSDVAGLRAARDGAPSVIIAAEGGDFLEGRPERVEDTHRRWSLRHLQLTHYRVNELGDIQTEPPVHGGLSDTGAEVIRRCNRLGVVVDVAHGTLDLVRRAVSVTTRPLILSHTDLTTRPVRFTRRITAEHAKLIAQTGGVIGVWPPASRFPTLDTLATGMARMVDVVGVDHVGLGTDMRGLVGPSIFPDYEALPGLAEALLKAGFSPADTGKILGGNYARVFEACMT